MRGSPRGVRAGRLRGAPPGRRPAGSRPRRDRTRPRSAGPSASSRTSAARRWRREPSKRLWRRSGANVRPRAGHSAASGQRSQRGTRARQTCAPRSKSAWFQSQARPARRRDLRRAEGALEHAPHVRVERRDVGAEGEAGHRACRVGADSRQPLEAGDVVGERAELDHAPRRVLEIERAAVVAEARPGAQDVRRGRRSQSRGGGPALEPGPVALQHAGHLCLLQHDLAHEDGVGIARPAPGQVARALAEPLE